MFSDLYDSISLLFYWQWPRVKGEVTAVRMLGGSGRLLIEYRFSLGDESGGPVRGEQHLSNLTA